MRRVAAGALVFSLAVVGCDHDRVLIVGDEPAAPLALFASYYGGVVTLEWELASRWNGEPFRVYAKRVTDPDFFFIAEVTNCAGGFCSYEDQNVVSGVSYEYFVTAVDPVSGVETASAEVVQVLVPDPVAPAVPTAVSAVALDDAIYLRWSDVARAAADFSHYRVYLLASDGSEYFLGETDSEGFLDLLAVNGATMSYFVTAVDDAGHESAASTVASGTPRPDYHGELVYDFVDQPDASGFRFQSDESEYPVLSGASIDRHFRLELDAAGWWLVPGPEATVYPQAFATTALKCGVGADAGCVDVSMAPSSGYVTNDVGLATQSSYVLRVVGDDGRIHYGVIRVELLGFDQNDDALMIFDWAYQLVADSPHLSIVGG